MPFLKIEAIPKATKIKNEKEGLQNKCLRKKINKLAKFGKRKKFLTLRQFGETGHIY